MTQSPYLQQALAELGQSDAPAAGPSLQVDPEQLAQFGQQRAAFKVSNPGQSYAMHNLQGAGQRAMGSLKGLFGLGAEAGK